MKTSKIFKAFSLASAVTISLFGMNLINQKSAFAVDITPPGWCIHSGAQILLGDFDGDHVRDALCYDKAGSKWFNYATGYNWYIQTSWCTHTGSYIQAVRYNSDDYYDLVCRDDNGGFWVTYALSNGHFSF